MGSDTDSVPQLDENDFAETVVLTDADRKKTREMSQPVDPDTSQADDSNT